jgi:hypothetical protein
MANRLTRRQFVLDRLDAGFDAMSIYQAATARFGHCGWLYVLSLKREWADAKEDATRQSIGTIDGRVASVGDVPNGRETPPQR